MASQSNANRYPAPTDRQIDSAVKVLKVLHRDFQKDITTAAKVLKKHRAVFAEIASIDEGLHPDGVSDELVVFTSIQAAGIISHVDNGTDLESASISDDDLVLVVNCVIAGGCPPWASERIMRIAAVSSFLVNPERTASIALASTEQHSQA